MRYNDPFSILPAPSLSMRLTFIRPQFSRSLVRSQKRWSRFLRSGRCLISEDTASCCLSRGINFAPMHLRTQVRNVDGAFELLRGQVIRDFRCDSILHTILYLKHNNSNLDLGDSLIFKIISSSGTKAYHQPSSFNFLENESDRQTRTTGKNPALTFRANRRRKFASGSIQFFV